MLSLSPSPTGFKPDSFSTTSYQEDTKFLSWGVGFILLPFAIWAFWAQIAFSLEWSLAETSRGYLVVLIIAITSYYHFRPTFYFCFPTHYYTLALISLVTATLALLAIRPDADDVTYLSRPVYFLAHFNEPLDTCIRHTAGEVSDAGHRYLFHTIEFFWASLSYISGVSFHKLVYCAQPFFFGALMPLTWFLLLRRFFKEKNLSVLFGVGSIIFFLCIDGVTHAGFGNCSIVRLWQGKMIFMSVMIPLFSALTINFLLATSLRNFIYLFIVVSASSCMSSTCLLLLHLGLILFIASFFKKRDSWSLRLVAIIITYSSWILPGIGILNSVIGSTSELNLATSKEVVPSFLNQQHFWAWYQSQITYVFGNHFFIGNTLLLIAVLFFPIHAFWSRHPYRFFLSFWIIFSTLIISIPMLIPSLTTWIFPQNTFWRVTRLLPLPLFIGYFAVATSDFKRIKSLFLGLMVIALLALGLNYSNSSGAVFADIPFAFWADKIDPIVRRESLQIIKHAPKGGTLAPEGYNWVIPIYSPNHPQILPRTVFFIEGPRGELFNFFYNNGQDLKSDDLESISQLNLLNILLETKEKVSVPMKNFLNKQGFKRLYKSERITLYSKYPELQD